MTFTVEPPPPRASVDTDTDTDTDLADPDLADTDLADTDLADTDPTIADRGPAARTPADPAALEAVETDFTVVARGWRGRGLGSAVKAASVLALLADGHRRFRTGGATENGASVAAAHSLGYIVDERWLTLAPPVVTRHPG
jgi:GNAT superfamily N-acetyltransferase